MVRMFFKGLSESHLQQRELLFMLVNNRGEDVQAAFGGRVQMWSRAGGRSGRGTQLRVT